MLARSIITRSRRRNSPRPAEKSCRSFLAWLRGRPCFLEWTGECAVIGTRKPIEPAHVDHAGGKGMATKVADRHCIPLCPRHHDEQHRGWRSFEAKYEFNAVRTAERYWQSWPGRIAWESRLEGRG